MSHTLAVNASVRVEPPQAFGSIQETPPLRKSGRPPGSKDLKQRRRSQKRHIEHGDILQVLRMNEVVPV